MDHRSSLADQEEGSRAIVLPWGVIAYGAALSAVLALLLVLVVARERRPAVLGSVVLATAAGPVAWNAILRATRADQFFTDAPIRVFPISLQDTGSGVFAVATLALVLGLGALRADTGRRVGMFSALGGIGALLVNIYLY